MITGKMEKVGRWIFLAGVFTIPLSGFVSVRLLILALLASFFTKKNYSLLLTRSWDLLLFFLVMAVGLIYSTNITSGLSVLETSVSLLAIPLIMCSVNKIDQAELYSVAHTFMAGVTIACVICLGNAGIEYAQSGDHRVFFSERFTDIIGSHPTYLAYYLIFSITFGLYIVFYDEQVTRYRSITSWMLFLFGVLILTSGRTAFTSMLLIFSFFLLKYILEERRRSKQIVFVAVCFMVLVMFVVHSLDYWSDVLVPMGDYWERGVLWESAIKANPNVLLGVGTGDYMDVLNEYFRSHKLLGYAEENYNSHNQFIQIYFSNGLIGLAALLFMLIRPMIKAIRSQNPLVVLVFFPFMIYGMTEVFLGRFQGVVFFALIHELFMANMDSVKTAFTLRSPEASLQ